MVLWRGDVIIGRWFGFVGLEYPRSYRTHLHYTISTRSISRFDIFSTRDPNDRIAKWGHRPPPGIGRAIAEGVEEEGGNDGAGLGAGGVGAAPNLHRPVQQPHNPPLFVDRREGDHDFGDLFGLSP